MFRTHHELSTAMPRSSPRNPGRSIPPSHRTTAASATVTSTASPRIPRPNTARVATISTTVATSHRTPLVCR
jgi:hypothetical protein